MAVVKVRRNFQITLPANLRKKFNIAEGDFIDMGEGGNGRIIIKPVKMIEPGQDYFFTKEWQADEAEADQDIAEGRVAGPFKSADDLISELES